MSNRNHSQGLRLGALLGFIFLIAGLISVAAPLRPAPSAITANQSALGTTNGNATSPATLSFPVQQSASQQAKESPSAVDAFAHLAPNPVLTATVGSKFTLDLLINSGTNTIVGQQSYMTFTNSLLQVVSTGSSGCVASTAVSPDLTTFSTLLQNVVDNDLGEIAYASGTFGGGVPPGSDFRVAQISFCASAPGDAIVHWQFSPPAPANRNSKIVDSSSNTVSNQALYVDGVIHIIGPTPTPTNTPTNTPIPPTNTPSSTPSNTPTNTPTITPVPPTFTSTPTIPPTGTPPNTPSKTPTNTPSKTPT
jgi:hypothetical protein